ncbi:MAG: EscC/YscC/HrcC family type III secretion system outer membrane ring protein [Xanthomonadales bacterium]|uniref:type III secretion system outer membrane ring subunit SctC n=1 Tax=Hydrogenophaga sp. TaxID=1904254 RepID=UPI0016AC3236|nr:type III secretion system outer membrane ring subunit SctC [Hydrogenophaga sp.]NIQ36740.1 EscC/YscC/HrcC family type III secretion system outer membrane ring protein [Xanthomonadales bacterium]NIM42008.1 EscC/YscC/HrcC family type III secretion system outer membrane ring protein [Hydrogenophaga sp.]NIN27311.1 EscC/YscC/HrcC family type III secretion system outer membrane ring protein [Hydrogenophaga sp.]NIN32012.1 EscC/YscC/HrcC family type III secretion system outer membrane ring protein [H
MKTLLRHRWLGPLLFWALAGALCLGVVDVRASETPATSAPWPNSAFSYINRNQSLEQVLKDFTTTFGLRLQIEDDLSSEPMPASGRSQSASPGEFLNQLGAAHGLNWYHHAGVLYISRISSRATQSFSTRGLPPDTLKRVVNDLGLFDERFGWSGVPERGAVFVSGPSSYVERIGRAIEALPQPSSDQRLMVYRLRHAAVDDRTLRYRDTVVTTPGVATVLRGLVGLSADRIDTAPVVANDTRMGEPRELPERSQIAAAAASQRGGKRGDSGAAGIAPMIISDARLNAIIIKDAPQNEPVYRQLIEALDVPNSLIEIEAMILDVNSTSLKDLGIDWRVSGSSSRSLSFGVPDLAPDRNTLVYSGLGTIADVLARIRLLESKGAARIVSRPSILTQDNMGAMIDLSDTFYIQTVGERVAEVQPITVGISLRVVPRIVEDEKGRAIHLVIDIEDGSIQDVQVGTLPTVRRSTIGTQAMVLENRSLVIGGFNAQRNLRQRDQVPVLGDVPVVGNLFSKTTRREETYERLFFITPRVVPLHQAGLDSTQKAQP